MKIRLFNIAVSLIISLTIFCCGNQNFRKKKINFNNPDEIDSLIKITADSKDTLFLGFTIGMSKKDYQNHIKKLRKEGKSLTYSKFNKMSLFGSSIKLGEGYTFTTNIVGEVSDKEYKGVGKYFLSPKYNNKGKLLELIIFKQEKWDDNSYGFKSPTWLESRIIKNSKYLNNESLRKAMRDYQYCNTAHFIREKGNLVIYESIGRIHYIHRKALFFDLLIKATQKQTIKEDNENIQF